MQRYYRARILPMIDVDQPARLLGGLTPDRFMRRHWHKKPLLVRQAWPGIVPPVSRAGLFALAAREDVESRLVAREGRRWLLRPGPLVRRALPPLSQASWTLLVQGLDLHVDAAHALLSRFRFVPDARLDDLMVSYASDGGSVGPHIDSYDVFLLQIAGRRRWRYGRCVRPVMRDDVPLKMLSRFEPTESHLLEPGDMLYLPPGWAHEGTAVGGDCMTASIGFRAPTQAELARVLLERLADNVDDGASHQSPRYRDAGQAATAQPGAVPAALQAFAQQALQRALAEPGAIARALGEWLTEPKPQVWFEGQLGAALGADDGLALDRRTRMGYDERQVFINGESFSAGGRDARLMRRLADLRALAPADLRRLSAGARALIAEWQQAGWLHARPEASLDRGAHRRA
jgi:50S ribosomal protein L16 3-hydroxylase